ncbi:MAG: hypothetical protein O2816_07230, partial [Planctomycetota bacterium]|nr:hypothetical protein [Planctomycetota bacterium]
MKLVPLLVLVALSALMTLVGMSLESSRADRSAWNQAEDLLFPDLDVEQATRLVIDTADGTATVVLVDGVWTVAERSNYPARGDEVGRLLNGLATALYVEPKTATPGLYEKLGLATVEAILEGLDARLEALGEELGALAEQVGVTPLAADPGESEEAIEARLA